MKISFFSYFLVWIAILSTIKASGQSVRVTEANDTTSTLIVKVEGLKNTKGTLRAILYNTPEGFPGSKENAFRLLNKEISNTTVYLKFDNIPEGEYALAITHDENENFEVDRNMFGVPTEGYGTSNNAKGSILGPPSFKEAAFTLDDDRKEISINMVY